MGEKEVAIMSRLTLDPTTAALANQATDVMEVCDTSGRLLGHFLPVAAPVDYAALDMPISDEELDRRERTEGGRSLKDMLADLETADERCRRKAPRDSRFKYRGS